MYIATMFMTFLISLFAVIGLNMSIAFSKAEIHSVANRYTLSLLAQAQAKELNSLATQEQQNPAGPFSDMTPTSVTSVCPSTNYCNFTGNVSGHVASASGSGGGLVGGGGGGGAGSSSSQAVNSNIGEQRLSVTLTANVYDGTGSLFTRTRNVIIRVFNQPPYAALNAVSDSTNGVAQSADTACSRGTTSCGGDDSVLHSYAICNIPVPSGDPQYNYYVTQCQSRGYSLYPSGQYVLETTDAHAVTWNDPNAPPPAWNP